MAKKNTASKTNTKTADVDEPELEQVAPADLRYHGDGSGMVPRAEVERVHGKETHDANIREAKRIRSQRRDA